MSPKDAPLTRNDEIAGQGDFEAGRDRGTIDSTDHGLTRDRPRPVLAGRGTDQTQIVAGRAEFAQVETCAEGVAGSGENGRAHGWIGSHVFHGCGELLNQ